MTPVLTLPLTRWPLLIAAASLLLLLGAWTFQYVWHYDPCPLCYSQRHIHMGVLALGLASGIALVLRPALERFVPLAMFALAAILVYSAGFAAWHAGIEYGWWEGPATCGAIGAGGVSTADVLAALDGQRPIVQCDEAAWRLLGISMAGYNALISAGLAALSVLVGIRGWQR